MTSSVLQALHQKMSRLSAQRLPVLPVGCSAGPAGLCLSAQRGLQAQQQKISRDTACRSGHGRDRPLSGVPAA